MKSGILNLLETSGPVQACNGIALTLPLPYFNRLIHLHQYLTKHKSVNTIGAG